MELTLKCISFCWRGWQKLKSAALDVTTMVTNYSDMQTPEGRNSKGQGSNRGPRGGDVYYDYTCLLLGQWSAPPETQEWCTIVQLTCNRLVLGGVCNNLFIVIPMIISSYKSYFRAPKSLKSHIYQLWTKVVSELISYSQIFCKCSWFLVF